MFGPLNDGFVSTDSSASTSAADNEPPAASRPPPAITPRMKVRRGNAVGPRAGFRKWSVIFSLTYRVPAHRAYRLGTPDYNTRCTVGLLQKSLALSVRTVEERTRAKRVAPADPMPYCAIPLY